MRYAWSSHNRLAAVTGPGLAVRFGYDADGALVRQEGSDGQVTHYVGGQMEVAVGAGVGGQDVVTKRYLADGQVVALRRENDLDPARNGRFTIHSDHLSSTSLLLRNAEDGAQPSLLPANADVLR